MYSKLSIFLTEVRAHVAQSLSRTKVQKLEQPVCACPLPTRAPELHAPAPRVAPTGSWSRAAKLRAPATQDYSCGQMEEGTSHIPRILGCALVHMVA